MNGTTTRLMQRIGPVQLDHRPRDPEDHQTAAQHLDQGKADSLLNGAGVVGDAAHEVAALMAGVVTQGELVQMFEDFGLQAAEHMLARPAHHEKHQPARQCAHDIDNQHPQHQPAQAGDVGIHRRAWRRFTEPTGVGAVGGRAGHRRVGRRLSGRGNPRRHFCCHCGRQVTIHRLPQQFGRDHLGPGVHDHQYQHTHQHQPVGAKIASQPAQGTAHSCAACLLLVPGGPAVHPSYRCSLPDHVVQVSRGDVVTW